MAFVSYAQNFEDVLLNRVFGGQQTGFYIDIGAYHPVEGSVTKAFYDRGWSGINVEPGSIFETLAAARPRDINLRMAVLDRTGEVAFLEDAADRGMSHVLEADGTGTTNTVPCDTLEGIVAAHARGRPVDFIKVDAEGAELAIFRSTDWRRLRPRMLVAEATLPWSNVLANAEWEAILLAGGYVRVYFDGINCFYLPEEEVPALGQHFRVPVNVLDGVSVYRHEVASELANAQAAVENLRQEVNVLREERDALHEERNASEAERFRQQQIIAELTRDRDAAVAEQFRQQQTIAGLTRDRDDLDIKNRNALIELDDVRAACQALETRVVQLMPPAPSPAPASDAAPGIVAMASPPPRPRLIKRAVKIAYSLVRPIVRPIAWRLRSFGIGPLLGELQHMREAQATTAAAAADLNNNLARFMQRLGVEPITDLAPESLGGPEMRRLAEEMERALLTLAMGTATQPALVDDPSPAASSTSNDLLRGL